MNWTEKYIKTKDGFCLYTRHIGQGEPLLLIHGAIVDSEFFSDFGKIMAEKYHVITYDRRGYGFSRTDPGKEEREAHRYGSSSFFALSNVAIFYCFLMALRMTFHMFSPRRISVISS